MIIDSKNLPPNLRGNAIKVLCYLAEVGGSKMTDIAQAAGFSTAACTGCADTAEKQGLINRVHCREDRRVVLLGLTDRGRELVESWRPQPEPVEAPELEEAVA